MKNLERRDFLALFGIGAASLGLGQRALGQAVVDQASDADAAHASRDADELSKHGYFLMIAEWEVKDGSIEQAKAIIEQYRPYILQAEGIELFLVAQGIDDPNHITFYEAYASEALYKKHAQGEAFQRYIVKEGLPLVAKRTLTRYRLV
jgi:quinol monooxygenase YgiN